MNSVFSWSWILAAGLLLAPLVEAADELEMERSRVKLESLLRCYQGTWEGVFTVSSVEPGLEQSMRVRQIYWWDAIGLRGLAVFERGGVMQTASSLSLVENGRLFSQVEREGGVVELYRGMVDGESIVWVPASTALGAEPRSQTRERIVVEDRRVRLVTTGFDTVRQGSRQMRLIYRGSLDYVGPPS